jgi:hypothetical protein
MSLGPGATRLSDALCWPCLAGTFSTSTGLAQQLTRRPDPHESVVLTILEIIYNKAKQRGDVTPAFIVMPEHKWEVVRRQKSSWQCSLLFLGPCFCQVTTVLLSGASSLAACTMCEAGTFWTGSGRQLNSLNPDGVRIL